MRLTQPHNLLLVFTLLIGLAFSGAVTADEYPPILEYYPNCKYKVSDTISKSTSLKTSGSYGYKTNPHRRLVRLKGKTSRVLMSIRKQAKEKNADALILVSRTTKDREMPNSLRVDLKFKAELITQCDDLSANKAMPAPIQAKDLGGEAFSLDHQ